MARYSFVVLKVPLNTNQTDEETNCGWLSVTFVYCVETAKDRAIVAVECE